MSSSEDWGWIISVSSFTNPLESLSISQSIASVFWSQRCLSILCVFSSSNNFRIYRSSVTTFPKIPPWNHHLQQLEPPMAIRLIFPLERWSNMSFKERFNPDWLEDWLAISFHQNRKPVNHKLRNILQYLLAKISQLRSIKSLYNLQYNKSNNQLNISINKWYQNLHDSPASIHKLGLVKCRQ